MVSKYEFNVASRENFFRHPEEYMVEPFKIYGNMYYVGNKSVGSHLFDTGEGLILVDTTYPTTVHMVVNSIWKLGFNPEDIKYIIHTHGHFDHFGGTTFLKKISNAKLCLAEGDAKMFKERPELAMLDCSKYSYTELFEPDIILHDKDVITLGNTSIRIVTTPGHSDGVISFFVEVTENGVTKIAGMHGGAGMNTMCRTFIEKYHVEHCRKDFVEGVKKVYDEHVDIMLGNHAGHNKTVEKRAYMLEYPEEPNPFINPKEWKEYLDFVMNRYNTMLEEEKNGTDLV